MSLNNKQKAWILAGLAAVAISLALSAPEPAPALRESVPVVVQTVPLRVADVFPVDRVMGKLVPSHTAHIHFEVSGRVIRRMVEPGQRVVTGDPLLDIEDGDLVDTLTQAQASLDEEVAAISRDKRLLSLVIGERKLQEEEVGRLQRLEKDSLTSRSRSGEARQKLYRLLATEARLNHSVDTASARTGRRTAERNRAQRNLDRAHLVSPFVAQVNAVEVEVGDYVSPGQAAVDLIQLDQLDLYVEVTGDTARNLGLDAVVRVSVGETVHTGRVIALASDPDPLTHTHALRIRMPANGLAPGQLAAAQLPLNPLLGVSAVPVTALLREDGVASVFVVVGDQLARQVVRPGRRDGNWQIVSGLDPGALIVARDVAALTDGQRVLVEDISHEMHAAEKPSGQHL